MQNPSVPFVRNPMRVPHQSSFLSLAVTHMSFADIRPPKNSRQSKKPEVMEHILDKAGIITFTARHADKMDDDDVDSAAMKNYCASTRLSVERSSVLIDWKNFAL